jgi:hypothetical protein
MKVKVTTERDCCHPAEDLQSYRGSSGIPEVLRPKFCRHCGQLWYLNRFTDWAGSSDSEYVRHMPEIRKTDADRGLKSFGESMANYQAENLRQ